MNTQKSSLEFSHFPVMLNEIIEISSASRGGVFIDCTFGGGGYSKELLKYPKTKVIGLDRDTYIISIAKKLEKKFDKRFKFYQLKFSQIDKLIKEYVDGIIFDLGLSSIQLNNLKRGIFFQIKRRFGYVNGSI